MFRQLLLERRTLSKYKTQIISSIIIFHFLQNNMFISLSYSQQIVVLMIVSREEKYVVKNFHYYSSNSQINKIPFPPYTITYLYIPNEFSYAFIHSTSHLWLGKRWMAPWAHHMPSMYSLTERQSQFLVCHDIVSLCFPGWPQTCDSPAPAS